MEIKICIFGHVYSIAIGYKTPWFEQTRFLSVDEIWYDEYREVVYAKQIFSTN